jgi:hypothetical protein
MGKAVSVKVCQPNDDQPPRAPTPLESQPTQGSPATTPAVTAAVVPPPSGDEGFDFRYESWVEHANAGNATSVHTDEGTTIVSGSDAIVIGGDGYDDDDNRAAGREHRQHA